MDISSLLEVQVNEDLTSTIPGVTTEVDRDEAKILRPSEQVSIEEKHFYKLMFGNDIAQVRFRKLHCTSCDMHIGSAPSEAHNMQEHPVLKVLLCGSCRDFYGDGAFEQGDDATDMFCRWCANGGNLYCCSYCSNTFCQKCIRINFDAHVRNQIEADEKWRCFVCHPAPLYSHRAVCWALLQHVKTVSRILSSDQSLDSSEYLDKMEQDDTTCCSGRKPKRRRKNSNSDSDDSTTSSTKSSRSRKRAKRRRLTSRDKSMENINGRLVPLTRQSHKIEDHDITSLLNPEQTMIEDEQVLIPGSGLQRIEPKPDVVINNRSLPFHTIQTQSLLRGAITRGGKMMIPIRPLRRIDVLPSGANAQVITRLPGRPSAPMVTIPTRPILIAAPKQPGSSPKSMASSKSAVPSSKPSGASAKPSVASNASAKPPVLSSIQRLKNYPTIRIDRNDPKLKVKPSTPSVIDLESDSDESTAVTDKVQTPIANDNEHADNNDDLDNTEQSDNNDKTYPRLTVRRFDRTISNPIRAIDDILNKFKKRLKNEMDCFDDTPDGSEINSAKIKLRIVNKNINKIVSELAAFNNSMIRQYKPWKTSCLTGEPIVDKVGNIKLRKGEPSHKIIPLEMECEDDSDADIDLNDDNDEEEIEEHIRIDYSDKLIDFNEKQMIDKSCSTEVDTKDMGIQVYDNYKIDYDMKIGYSLLMKAEFDYKQNKEIFKPARVYDEYFGKYEEEFIYYLQNFEDNYDNIIDDDDEKENASPIDKTLNEIIDYDLSQINKRDKICEKLLDDEFNVNSDVINSNDKIIESDKFEDTICTTETIELSDDINKSDDADRSKDILNSSVDSLSENMDTTTEGSSRDDAEVNNTEKIEELSATTSKDNDDDNVENGECEESVSLSQGSKGNAAVIAVKALIEDDEEVLRKEWKKNGEDDEECTILE